MSLQIWAINVFSAIAIVIGGWGMLTHVFPRIEEILKPIIKDKVSLKSFMGLLNIIILWIVAQGIINYLLKINNPVLNFIEVFTPALDIFLEFLPYLKWVILGWFIIIAFKKR